jgi:hypothetical protein
MLIELLKFCELWIANNRQLNGEFQRLKQFIANELVIAVICLVDNKLTSDSEQYKRVLRIFVKS